MPSTVSAMGRTAIRFAWRPVSKTAPHRGAVSTETHVFDIRARVDRDDVAVLDTKIVADNTVQPSAAIIEIIVGQHDEHGVLSLLAPNQDCVAAEELKRLHGVVRESDDRVVIIDGISNPMFRWSAGGPQTPREGPRRTSTGSASSSS